MVIVHSVMCKCKLILTHSHTSCSGHRQPSHQSRRCISNTLNGSYQTPLVFKHLSKVGVQFSFSTQLGLFGWVGRNCTPKHTLTSTHTTTTFTFIPSWGGLVCSSVAVGVFIVRLLLKMKNTKRSLEFVRAVQAPDFAVNLSSQMAVRGMPLEQCW